MNHVINQLKLNNNQVTSQIISDLIAEHRPIAERMKANFERFKASEVPIQSRKFTDVSKINNKLNNDFFGDIITTKIGYFAGKPISTVLDKPEEVNFAEEIKKEASQQHPEFRKWKMKDKEIKNFNTRNSVEDLDVETTKYMSVCGYGARLIYIDKDKFERVMNLPSWEVIFVRDGSTDEVQFVLRYYPITIIEGDKKIQKIWVEWYDNKNFTTYIENKEGVYFRQDEPKPHFVKGVPVVEFANNDELQGDCDKVLELIDAYDRTISDESSELEQFRLAYMYFKGVVPTKEIIDQAKQTGAYAMGEEDDVGFITKALQTEPIEKHLDRLEKNIMRFSNSVNFGDEAFGGNLSGVAMKFKLFGLETKCIISENKFKRGLREQFKLLSSLWKITRKIDIDYLQLWWEFKRNFPINLLEEADATGKLKGMVSERTRLAQLSIVDDVDWELAEMQKDEEGLFDLDSVELQKKEAEEALKKDEEGVE